MSDRNRVYAGLLFFLGSAQFITILMIGEAIAPGYSVHDNAISDLGIISAAQTLFNLSLFSIGLLIVVASYLFHRTHGKSWITVLFILAGIGAIGAGVFNLNFGIHGIFALTTFIFGNVVAIASATQVRGPLKTVFIVLGIVGLVALGLHLAGHIGRITTAYGPIGHGGGEIDRSLSVWPEL